MVVARNVNCLLLNFTVNMNRRGAKFQSQRKSSYGTMLRKYYAEKLQSHLKMEVSRNDILRQGQERHPLLLD